MTDSLHDGQASVFIPGLQVVDRYPSAGEFLSAIDHNIAYFDAIDDSIFEFRQQPYEVTKRVVSNFRERLGNTQLAELNTGAQHHFPAVGYMFDTYFGGSEKFGTDERAKALIGVMIGFSAEGVNAGDRNLIVLLNAAFEAGKNMPFLIEIDEVQLREVGENVDVARNVARSIDDWDHSEPVSNYLNLINDLKVAEGLIHDDDLSSVVFAEICNVIHIMQQAGIDDDASFSTAIEAIADNDMNLFYSNLRLWNKDRGGFLAKMELSSKPLKQLWQKVKPHLQNIRQANLVRKHTAALSSWNESWNANRPNKFILDAFRNTVFPVLFDQIEGADADEFSVIERLELDNARARAAGALLMRNLNISDADTMAELERLANKPLHRGIELLVDKQKQEFKEERLRQIDVKIDELDDLYRSSASIMRKEVENGVARRKNMKNGMDRRSIAYNIEDLDQLLVLTSTIEMKNRHQGISDLIDCMDNLTQLESEASKLGRDEIRSEVLRALTFAQQLVEIHQNDDPQDNKSALIDGSVKQLYADIFERDDLKEAIDQATVTDIEIFPPPTESIEREFVERVKDAGQSYINKIDYSRIRRIIELRDILQTKHGMSCELKIAKSASWSPLPLLVLDIGDTGRFAVIESPIIGEASYVTNDESWKWHEVASWSRTEAQDIGAIPKHHRTSSGDHMEKLLKTVLEVR